MPIADYLNQTALIVARLQHTIYDDSAAATLEDLETVPTVDFRLVVDVSGGAANTGTVTATGSLDGSAKTETFTFTGPRSRTGTVLFDTITTITTSGLADEDPIPDVTVTCIDSTGGPIMTETTTSTAIRLVDTSSRYLVDGVWTASDATAYTLGSASLAINTIIRYNSIDYIVRSIKAPRDRAGTVNHLELALDR